MGQGVCKRRADEGDLPDVSAKSAPKATPAKSQPPANGLCNGKTAEQWKVLGNDSTKKSDWTAAYNAYSQGLKADPDHAMILSNRALCLEKLGRLEEAVADAQRCTELRPDFVKGFLRAATLLRELKRYHEGVEVLRKAPSNPEIQELLAKMKPEAEKYKASRLETLDAAERFKEEGNALFKTGFFEKALEKYAKALKACSDQKGDVAVAIRNNSAGCYQQLGDFHAVVRETNFVLEQHPDNCKALMRRMIALEPLEKYEEALADARRVIQMAPGNEAANKMQHRLGKIVRDRQREASAAGA